MSQDIRILCVEDIPADVVILNHALRQGGLQFRSKRVETVEAFLDELAHDPPDVILSDHGLGLFDGFTALELARQKCPDVPFIFVTGSVGDQETVEMFQRGAAAHVVKHNLGSLVPAIRRALKEAQERRNWRQKEQELCESEERYRRLVDQSPDAAFVVRADDRIAFVNPAAIRLVGAASAEEVVGKPATTIFQPDPWDALVGRLRLQRRQEPLPTFVEQRIRRLDGGEREAEVCGAPTMFEGHPAVQVIAHDIGERKQAAEQLRQSEALKTAILETALDAILSVDREGKIQEWNHAAEKLFGYSRTQALGRSMDELIVPIAMSQVYQEGLTSYLMNGAGSLVGRPVELTLRDSQGREFRAEMAISRLLTENPPRCTALIRDITERQQAEARLRESEGRLRLLVSSVRDYAIYTLDPDGRVTSWNAGAERIKGYRSQEILGKPFATFFPAEDAQAGLPERLLRQAAEHGQASYEGWRVRKDGSRFWIEGTITAMRDEKGRLYGFSKIARDISKQKEADEEIRRLNEQLEQRVRERTAQLEEANRELEAFSYSISHDLRAPLRHIAGYVELLQDEAGRQLSEPAQQHLRTIASSAAYLGNLIDALLAFSKMGRSEMRRRPVDLAGLVQDARHELRQDMAGRTIDWHVGELPQVQGDPVMLRQVVINLLSNAIKYTRARKRARIDISATDNGEEIIFAVRDNGVGFDMKYAQKLFGVFQRLHGNRQFEGIGIGLANVRRIIQRHDGRTWAESNPNSGATFFFSIPKKQKGHT